MKISDYRLSLALLLCCSLAFVAFSFPPPAQGQAEACRTATGPPTEDPLGRGTPYGTVIGFLQAANKGEYKAGRQLPGGQAVRQEKSRARARSPGGPEPRPEHRRG